MGDEEKSAMDIYREISNFVQQELAPKDRERKAQEDPLEYIIKMPPVYELKQRELPAIYALSEDVRDYVEMNKLDVYVSPSEGLEEWHTHTQGVHQPMAVFEHTVQWLSRKGKAAENRRRYEKECLESLTGQVEKELYLQHETEKDDAFCIVYYWEGKTGHTRPEHKNVSRISIRTMPTTTYRVQGELRYAFLCIRENPPGEEEPLEEDMDVIIEEGDIVEDVKSIPALPPLPTLPRSHRPDPDSIPQDNEYMKPHAK